MAHESLFRQIEPEFLAAYEAIENAAKTASAIRRAGLGPWHPLRSEPKARDFLEQVQRTAEKLQDAVHALNARHTKIRRRLVKALRPLRQQTPVSAFGCAGLFAWDVLRDVLVHWEKFWQGVAPYASSTREGSYQALRDLVDLWNYSQGEWDSLVARLEAELRDAEVILKSAGDAPETLASPSKKRSTVKGEARVKIIAALTLHHKYRDGSCLNQAPIGVNELAKKTGVSKSTASSFFKDRFGGHVKYRAACRDKMKLIAALRLLNDEFPPKHLFGRTPPAEGDDDDE
jgi:hypothetical protein